MKNLIIRQLLTYLDKSSKNTFLLKCRDYLDKSLKYTLIVHPRGLESKFALLSDSPDVSIHFELKSIDTYDFGSLIPTELTEQVYTNSGFLRKSSSIYITKEISLFLELFQNSKSIHVCVIQYDHGLLNCVFFAGKMFIVNVKDENYILVERPCFFILKEFSHPQVVSFTTLPGMSKTKFIAFHKEMAAAKNLNFVLS